MGNNSKEILRSLSLCNKQFLGILAVGLAIVGLTWGTIVYPRIPRADEATWQLAALSILYDFDLRFAQEDIARASKLFEQNGYLILASDNRGVELYFPVPLVYPILTAPFYLLTANAFVLLNMAVALILLIYLYKRSYDMMFFLLVPAVSLIPYSLPVLLDALFIYIFFTTSSLTLRVITFVVVSWQQPLFLLFLPVLLKKRYTYALNYLVSVFLLLLIGSLHFLTLSHIHPLLFEEFLVLDLSKIAHNTDWQNYLNTLQPYPMNNTFILSFLLSGAGGLFLAFPFLVTFLKEKKFSIIFLIWVPLELIFPRLHLFSSYLYPGGGKVFFYLTFIVPFIASTIRKSYLSYLLLLLSLPIHFTNFLRYDPALTLPFYKSRFLLPSGYITYITYLPFSVHNMGKYKLYIENRCIKSESSSYLYIYTDIDCVGMLESNIKDVNVKIAAYVPDTKLYFKTTENSWYVDFDSRGKRTGVDLYLTVTPKGTPFYIYASTDRFSKSSFIIFLKHRLE